MFGRGSCTVVLGKLLMELQIPSLPSRIMNNTNKDKSVAIEMEKGFTATVRKFRKQCNGISTVLEQFVISFTKLIVNVLDVCLAKSKVTSLVV